MPDESERSKPTVQEIAALDVATAIELARAGGAAGRDRVFETHREMMPARDRSGLVSAPPREVSGMMPVPREVSGREVSGMMQVPRARAGVVQMEMLSPGSGAVRRPEFASGTLSQADTLPGARPVAPAMPAMPAMVASGLAQPGAAGEDLARATVQMRAMDASVRSVPSHLLPKNVDPRLVLLAAPDSEQAAAFRVLRYRVEQEDRDPLRTTVLAVCAPRSGQGGTTTAANLALALAECNRARVCLMEGNLRRPALAGLFRFKPPLCLAQRLLTDRDRPLEPWSVAELTPSLHVLAMDEKSERRPLVDGPAFAAGVEALRRAGYRHVVVDGPEVLGIADMNLIEEVVDGVLLVARGGETTAADLQVAAGQLASKKLRGIVLLDGE